MHTIFNLSGKLVTIENLYEAKRFCELAIAWHEDRKTRKENGDTDVIYFKQAHKEYIHDLKEIVKLIEKENKS